MLSADRLYVGAPELAERLFGNRDSRNVRRIHHWNTLKPPKRPPFLRNIGNSPAAFESGLQDFAAGSNTDTAAS